MLFRISLMYFIAGSQTSAIRLLQWPYIWQGGKYCVDNWSFYCFHWFLGRPGHIGLICLEHKLPFKLCSFVTNIMLAEKARSKYCFNSAFCQSYWNSCNLVSSLWIGYFYRAPSFVYYEVSPPSLLTYFIYKMINTDLPSRSTWIVQVANNMV